MRSARARSAALAAAPLLMASGLGVILDEPDAIARGTLSATPDAGGTSAEVVFTTSGTCGADTVSTVFTVTGAGFARVSSVALPEPLPSPARVALPLGMSWADLARASGVTVPLAGTATLTLACLGEAAAGTGLFSSTVTFSAPAARATEGRMPSFLEPAGAETLHHETTGVGTAEPVAPAEAAPESPPPGSGGIAASPTGAPPPATPSSATPSSATPSSATPQPEPSGTPAVEPSTPPGEESADDDDVRSRDWKSGGPGSAPEARRDRVIRLAAAFAPEGGAAPTPAPLPTRTPGPTATGSPEPTTPVPTTEPEPSPAPVTGATPEPAAGMFVVTEGSPPPATASETVPTPDAAPNSFHWTVPAGGEEIVLNTTQVGDFLASTGRMAAVDVTDTREGGPAWTISGQISDFRPALPGRYMGWRPVVVTPLDGVSAGSEVHPGGSAGGSGLRVPSLLGAADPGHPPGTASLGAELNLRLPRQTPAGTYTTVLTITALS